MSEAISNGVDPTTARRFVGEIDKCFAELESERGTYMQRCKNIRDRIADWKEQAQNAGIPRRGLNHLLKRRDLEAKLEQHEAEADEEIVETADMIREALGEFADSPLGGAAVKAVDAAPAKKAKAGKPKKGVALVGGDDGAAPKMGADDDEADLRGKQQKDRETARKAEAETRLAGIKPLDDQPKVH